MCYLLNKQRQNPNHPFISTLSTIKKDYLKNRYTFIPGNRMKEILRFLGASEKDLRDLEYSGSHLHTDPTLLFRMSRNGRFFIDFNKNSISRLEFQPFDLSKEEDFIRNDSGKLRHFRGIEDRIQLNKAFQGLIKFKALIIEGVKILNRPNLIDSDDTWVSTIFQLRTITTAQMIGEPAKEGVHSDGVEHTMTTLLYTQNMNDISAITQIHSKNQETGISWKEIKKEHVLGEFQHQHFLDTLLIVDSELKHSVSSVNAIDKAKDAYRDMLILFSRRPKSESHSTFRYDSLNFHPDFPQNFPII